MAEVLVIVPKLSAAARTNVVIGRRVRQRIVHAYWAAISHGFTRPHSKAKNKSGPPCRAIFIGFTG